jgi:hypothetical protein
MVQIATDAPAGLAKAALLEITLASFEIPECIPLAGLIFENQCDPELIIKTGFQWLDLYGRLDTAKADIGTTASGIGPDDWSGTDRDAFGRHVSGYQGEIMGVQVLVMLTGVALIVVGTILLIFTVLAFAFATALAVLAGLIAAAEASVVGAELVVPLEAAAAAVVSAADTALTTVSDLASTTANAMARLISAAAAVDFGVQQGEGNTDVGGDLVQATVDSLDNIAWGLTSRVERDFALSGLSPGRHGIRYPGYVAYGLGTQDTPYGNSDGKADAGPGGVTDHIHNVVPDYNTTYDDH